MMAPVFSRTAWRCVWNMIQVCDNTFFKYFKNLLFFSPGSESLIILQNDLIHAWGLDMKLGYCVQVLIACGRILVLEKLFTLFYRATGAGRSGSWTVNI